MMEELDNIRKILNNEKIKFEKKNDGFHFKILKRKIRISLENEKIVTSILDYNGLRPFCHIDYIEKEKRGRICLDDNINAYHVDTFKSNYLKIIKNIILEKNHLEDSFNELEIQRNLIFSGECFYWKENNKKLIIQYLKTSFFWLRKNYFLNDVTILNIQWKGFKFRNYNQLVNCLENQKIDWNNDNLIIFEYDGRKKWIFIPKDYKIAYFIPNSCDPQTLMYKTGAKAKENSLIMIVGLGSLGSEIFERFRLAGYINFMLFDFDHLNPNNDYRWAYPTYAMQYKNKSKVDLIKNYFKYLNIITFKNKIENVDISKIDLNQFKNEINKLIFIDATANKNNEMNSLKLWYEISKEYHFNQSTYKLTFLEQNGLVLHTFSNNYSNNLNQFLFYKDELKNFSENWKQNKILKQNKKYVYQEGCVGETQIYSQNSTKSLTLIATHLLEEEEKQEDYIKINLLTKLIANKEKEWTNYYKKYKNKENDEIKIK